MAGPVWAVGQASRGAKLFERHHCVTCHAVNGKGGGAGPDLGTTVARGFTPVTMASLMWNHAPEMWRAMQAQGVERPRFSEEDAQDMFAYLFSARFFELPGDAARGKRVFVEKKCGNCHSTGTAPGIARPVADWESLADPITLIWQMWGHASEMKGALESKKMAWVTFTPQEMSDLVVYLRNLPGVPKIEASFAPPEEVRGESLFRENGCSGCHQGKLALEARLSGLTLTGVAAEMWNHAPRMKAAPAKMTAEDMRQVIAYVWTKQFLQGSGDAQRGKRQFETKKCAACHAGPAPSAPGLALGSGLYSSESMIHVLWRHGPSMWEQMKAKNIAWPKFVENELADLVAYLNANPRDVR